MTTNNHPLRRSLTVVVVALVVVTVLGVATTGIIAQAQESEPNDAPVNATAIDPKIPVSGVIESSGDRDVFAVEGQEGQPIRVEFFVGGWSKPRHVELHVQLLAPSGDELDSAVAGRFDRVVVNSTAAEPGTYYVRVTPVGEVATSAYTVTVLRPQPPKSPDITPANLTTYTSDRAPYSIKYPVGWAITTTSPGGVVSIRPTWGNATLRIDRYTMTQPSTLQEIAARTTTRVRNTTTGYEKLGQRRVTLPTGQRALLLDVTYDDPEDWLGPQRVKALLVVVDTHVYVVTMSFDRKHYTVELDQVTTTILTSLTIEPSRSQTDVASTPSTTQTPLAPPATPTAPATPLGTPTKTPTDPVTELSPGMATVSDSGTASGEPGGSSTFGPGFTLVGTLVALFAATLLAVYRLER